MTIGANGNMDEAAFYDLIDKNNLCFIACKGCSQGKHYWWTRA
jgi:hypothetical protein